MSELPPGFELIPSGPRSAPFKGLRQSMQGYVESQPMTGLDGVDQELAARVAPMIANSGGDMTGIRSGVRSPQEQAMLRARYLRGEGAPAAPPGSSRHETGDAVDVGLRGAPGSPDRRLAEQTIYDRARHFGLRHTVPGEAWHVETDPRWQGAMLPVNQGVPAQAMGFAPQAKPPQNIQNGPPQSFKPTPVEVRDLPPLKQTELPSGFEIMPDVQDSPRMGFASPQERDGATRYSEGLSRALEERRNMGAFGKVDAAVRGAAGWIPGMDKLAAAGDAATGSGSTFSDRYAANLERQRMIDEADKIVSGKSRLAGQTAGLIGVGAVLPTAQVASGTGRMAQAVNSGVTGGLYAGGSAAIENDGGVAEKATAAAQAAPVGLALGAAAPAVVQGAGALVRGVGNMAAAPINTVRGLINPEAEAARRVGAALSRDGVKSAADELATMQATGAPAVLADVGGETTRALARSAANISPEARQAIAEPVKDRFLGQTDRIAETLRSLGRADASKTIDELQNAARAANRPAYMKAYQEGGMGVWSDDLAQIAQAPAVQAAIKDVIKTGANKTVAQGMPPVRNPFTADAEGNLRLAQKADGSVAYPNLQFWDYVQRALRGKEGEAGRAGNKDLASDYGNLRRMIVDNLDNQVPSFKEARQGAAKFFGAEDALEAGQKFVLSRMANDEARKALSRMSPQERELFSEGFRSDLIAKIKETSDNRNIVNAIFNSPAAKERAQIALGKEGSAQLEAALRAETAMDALRGALGNSTTARQLAEIGLAAGGVGYGAYTGDWDKAGLAIGAAGMSRGKAMAENKVAKRVADLLMSNDPEKFKRVVLSAAKEPRMMKALNDIADRVGRITSTQAGNESSPLAITLRPRMSGSVPAAADQEQ